MKTPKPASLTPKELGRVLLPFGGEQQPRVISGIHDNPGILTHDVCGSFYCNNVPDIAQKTNARLLKNGLKLFCTKPTNPLAITKSHHWYLSSVGELEFLDFGLSANDELE
jgi:hypothetical protein